MRVQLGLCPNHIRSTNGEWLWTCRFQQATEWTMTSLHSCVRYPVFVDDKMEHIWCLGRCTQLLVKMDLRDAYRMVPIHPHDLSLLASFWQGQTCWPCLPFGLQSAPKLFSAVTEPIAWVLHCHRVRYLLYYLDVFQFLGSLFTDEPAATLLRVAHVSTVGDTCGLKQNQSSNNLCDLSWHPHWHKCLWTEASHRQVDLTASTTE